jgi:hypothetical protein
MLTDEEIKKEEVPEGSERHTLIKFSFPKDRVEQIVSVDVNVTEASRDKTTSFKKNEDVALEEGDFNFRVIIPPYQEEPLPSNSRVLEVDDTIGTASIARKPDTTPKHRGLFYDSSDEDSVESVETTHTTGKYKTTYEERAVVTTHTGGQYKTTSNEKVVEKHTEHYDSTEDSDDPFNLTGKLVIDEVEAKRRATVGNQLRKKPYRTRNKTYWKNKKDNLQLRNPRTNRRPVPFGIEHEQARLRRIRRFFGNNWIREGAPEPYTPEALYYQGTKGTYIKGYGSSIYRCPYTPPFNTTPTVALGQRTEQAQSFNRNKCLQYLLNSWFPPNTVADYDPNTFYTRELQLNRERTARGFPLFNENLIEIHNEYTKPQPTKPKKRNNKRNRGKNNKNNDNDKNKKHRGHFA